MGTGYIRQDTSNNISDASTIEASDLDAEYDAIEDAFDASTGHDHGGGSANGAPITKTGPAQEYLSDGTALYPKTDDTYDLGKSAAEWKDIYIDGTAYLDTVDIDAGAIDGTVIGGATPAAGTFTDVTATGTITLTGATVANGGTVTTVDINGGTIDGTTLGASSASTAVVTDLTASGTIDFTGATISDAGAVTTIDINGGTIDATAIGGSTPAAGAFTTITSSSTATFGTIIKVGDGSETVPSLTFTNAATTGFYLSGANDITVTTNGGDLCSFLNASGNKRIGLGTTDADPASVPEVGIALNSTTGIISASASSAAALSLNLSGTNGSITTFRKGGTTVGSISVTNSNTAYNTSSDHRLKFGSTSIESPIDQLMKLKPYEGYFNAEPDVKVHYMFAHEMQEVLPWAVTGEKDGLHYQEVDYSKEIPLLTAALQEAITELREVRKELEELKSKSSRKK